MNIEQEIEKYIASQPEPKRSEMQELDQLIRDTFPGCRLWFSDGTNDEGKVVSNPTVGYGQYTIRYANGTTKDFFQIGLVAVKTGISVYILGIKDKNYLPGTFGGKLGKASVTGYCIKFKTLKDINIDVLTEAMREGVKQEQ